MTDVLMALLAITLLLEGIMYLFSNVSVEKQQLEDGKQQIRQFMRTGRIVARMFYYPPALFVLISVVFFGAYV